MTLNKRKMCAAPLTTLVAASCFVAMFVLVGDGARADRPASLTLLGTCELPEDVSEVEGWDVDPTGGNWGGKDTSEFAVVWAAGGPDLPSLTGREAICSIPGQTAYMPKMIKVHALNGLANDDYCVFIDIGGDFVRVGCYDETAPNEEWVTTEFTLPVKQVVLGQDVTLSIFACGNSWSGFNTYGQLAIDYIEVWGLEVVPRPGR